ncbi:MAG: DUF3179 domain-containing protein [Acidobacteria bacterium]|nr:DUF3179 domain-containing protein [Acidobacteriota bacterium]
MTVGNRTDRRRLLDLKGGGWVILIAAVLAILALAQGLVVIFKPGRSAAIGDGKNTPTYGFDLTNCLVEGIVASGLPKDGLQALSNPRHLGADELDSLGQRKFLVPGDRVVGVEIEGQSRAYPLSILSWHEIVNDNLAGRPIAVTYSPLCDSVVVFDGRVDGEIVELGFSGLLYNSNLIMYDRQAGGRRESLWSQLQSRAVSGRLAGRPLTVLHASLIRWADWRALHPDTTVVVGVTEMGREYRRNPYSSYYGSDELKFAVSPLPPSRPYKKQIIVVTVDGSRRVYSLDAIATRAGASRRWSVQQGRAHLTFDYSLDPPTVRVSADASVEVIYAFWFAWYSTHPGDRIWDE